MIGGAMTIEGNELYECVECHAVIDPYSDDFVTEIICGDCLENPRDLSRNTQKELIEFAKGAAGRLGLN